MNRLSTLWRARQPRERRLLLLGASCGLLALLWLSVQAVRDHQQLAWQQTRQAQAELATMQQQGVLLEPLLARQQRQHSADWQVEVLALATQQGLQLEVAGRDHEQLLFGPARPDITRLMHWLQQLEQEYHVNATRLQLDSGSQGVTLSQLVLQRHD